MLLLTVHAVAVSVLAGLVWTVQLAVYPAFLRTGPALAPAAWADLHEAHSRALVTLTALPWAVQGVTLAVLLLDRPAGVPLPLVVVAAALGLATVVVTAAVSVPLHARLTPYDDAAARRLLSTNWWRTAAWTVATGVAGAMVVLAR